MLGKIGKIQNGALLTPAKRRQVGSTNSNTNLEPNPHINVRAMVLAGIAEQAIVRQIKIGVCADLKIHARFNHQRIAAFRHTRNIKAIPT
jgi:hypothetical protein